MTAVLLAGCGGGDPSAARQRFVSGPVVADVAGNRVAVSTSEGEVALELGPLGRDGGDVGELWWTRAPQGVEFGWTVAERPAGEGPLTADLSFDALVDVRPDGLHAILRDPRTGLGTLAVTGLAAWDALGEPLYARMVSLDAHRLRIRVEDPDAVYPITIDPVLTSATTVLSGDAAAAGRMGYALANAGDINQDGFDDLLVGEPYWNGAAGTDCGRVRLFLGSASGPATTEVWSFESDQAFARLGKALAGIGNFDGLRGPDVALGAPDYDGAGGVDSGRVFVFHALSAAPWLDPLPNLTLDGQNPSENCGNAIASDALDVNGDGYGDLAVGCPEGHGLASSSDPGRIDVWHGLPGGIPLLTPDWSLEGATAEDELGSAVANAGDVNGDGFDDLIVGAEDYQSDALTDDGWAAVYAGSASGLGATPLRQWLSGQQASRFGTHVGGAGDVNGDGYDDVLVAADYWDGDFANEGRIAVYLGSAQGPSASPAFTWLGGQTSAQAGGKESITAAGGSGAALGDFDGDGFADVAVAAFRFDGGGTDSGRVAVFPGTGAGVGPYADWQIDGEAAYVRAGYALVAGDFDGDGDADLVSGDWGANTNDGRARFHPGPLTGTDAAEVVTAGTGTNAFLGDNRYRGVYVSMTSDALLAEIEFKLDPTVPTTLLWTVYESLVEAGPYAQIAQFSSTANAGSGWVSSGGVQQLLQAGRYYFISTHWQDPSTYYNGVETLPQPLGTFGQVLGYRSGSGPPPVTVIGSPLTNVLYPTRLTLLPPTDADGDGAYGLSDCQDGVASNSPGAAEVCDGLDNDCDGGLDFAADTFEVTHTMTLASSNYLKGNRILATQDRLVTEVQAYFAASLLGPITLGIYEGGGPSGPWSLIFERSLVPTTTAGAWHAFEGLDLPLSAGTHYAFTYHWSGGGTYYWASGPTHPSWGTMLGGVSDAGPGLRTDGALTDNPSRYRMRILTSQEFDGDGDGSFACVDCDDADASVQFGGPELCDGADNDCNGLADADPGGEVDLDGDGFRSCAECDDGDGSAWPGAPELCDGADNDCDGVVPAVESDADGDGMRTCAGDCNDSDAGTYPGAPESCDGTDEDCDGIADNDAIVTVVGGGAGSAIPPSGTSGTTVVTADPLRDGVIADVNVLLNITHSFDADLDMTITSPAGSSVELATDVGGSGDNFTNTLFDDEASTPITAGLPPFTGSFQPEGSLATLNGQRAAGPWTLTLLDDAVGSSGALTSWALSVTIAGNADADNDGLTACFDCDETDGSVFVGAPEVCDGLDTNCDGVLGAAEVDGDGDGSPVCAGDCDDTEATVFVGAPEVCDGLDNDCDGVVPAVEGDLDGDGARVCGGDCDDANTSVSPGAPELCDGVDNDCNGALGATEVDGDGDGVLLCAGDCDDGTATTFPGAPEICDGGTDNDCNPATIEGIDNDGDGETSCTDCDDSNPARFGGAPELCDGWDDDCDGALGPGEVDFDGDGFLACTFNAGVTNPAFAGGDCVDGNAAIHPGAAEICDGLDTDCSGAAGAGEVDADFDTVMVCAGDCDDGDSGSWPGAVEVCDGVDNDCNTLIPSSEADADFDGFLVCGGDCDDSDSGTFPGAQQVCDGIDNTCSGLVPADEADADGDGQAICGGDCDDADATVTFGAPEVCDGQDNDCDGVLLVGEVDADGDGVAPCLGDCNDAAPSIAPGLPELCDGLDNDCNGVVPSAEVDADVDGYRVCAGDCDDGAATTYPGATELCNGVDDDCGASTAPGGEVDGDGDGSLSCADCDDGSASNTPGGVELCDGLDNDCNGAPDADLSGEVDGDGDGSLSCVDCDDSDAANGPALLESCDGQDNDCDGLADFDALGEVDGDGDGSLSCVDCDDAEASVFPGSAELCDGLDNDCDGSAPGEADADGDGVFACADCDDADAANFPGNVEVCDNADNNCDGVIEAGQADADGDGVNICDGDCDDAVAAVFPGNGEACDGLDNDCDAATTAVGGEGDGDGDGSPACADCDDGLAAVFPGDAEACDGQDNDCDAATSAPGGEADSDGDGFLACAECDDSEATAYPLALELCDGLDNDCSGSVPVAEADDDADGFRLCDGDCNDSDPTVNPGAIEVCDGVNNDCNSATNELGDEDGDGYAVCDGDCDDEESGAYPGAPEICDGIDTDCDVSTDEAVDDDGDGYAVCDGDCDDGASTVNPAASEVCDGSDTDCDPSTEVGLPETDADGDGSFLCDAAPDCDDGDPDTYPGAPELCDGADNNCDGSFDDAIEDSDGDGFSPCDGDCDDGVQAVNPNALEGCDGRDTDCDGEVPADEQDSDMDGALPCGGDCDDEDPLASPNGNEETEDVCFDGIDNDCDGLVDLEDDGCDGSTGDDDDSGDDDDTTAPTGDDDDSVVEPPPEQGCDCGLSVVGGGAGWMGLMVVGGLLGRRRRR